MIRVGCGCKEKELSHVSLAIGWGGVHANVPRDWGNFSVKMLTYLSQQRAILYIGSVYGF